METIESPCVKVCVLDTVTGYCIGCGRTGAEIGAWVGMGPANRRAVMATLPGRLDAMTSREARGGRERVRYRTRVPS
jgi:hypothetical protein